MSSSNDSNSSSSGSSSSSTPGRRLDEENEEKEKYLVHLQDMWTKEVSSIECIDFKRIRHVLPLARIKKIMKCDQDVRMIAAEAPILFAKACELFILDLTMRGWAFSQMQKRRTLQRSDIVQAISSSQLLKFLSQALPANSSDKEDEQADEDDDEEEDNAQDDNGADDKETGKNQRKRKTKAASDKKQITSKNATKKNNAAKMKKQKTDSSASTVHLEDPPVTTTAINSHLSSDQHFNHFPSMFPQLKTDLPMNPLHIQMQPAPAAASAGNGAINSTQATAQPFPLQQLNSPPPSDALPTSLLDLSASTTTASSQDQQQTGQPQQQKSAYFPPWRWPVC